MSDTTTRGVRVQVASFYIEEKSEPRAGFHFHGYRVRITNVGAETVRLVAREWFITDSDGNVEHVSGPGVIGEQPVIAPGQSFDYASFCTLRTAVGAMHGKYTMRTDTGDEFDAIIDPFSLEVPGSVN